MTFTHPKLTDSVVKRVIQLSRQDVREAKGYLAKTLGVKKSQKNDWYRKIMTNAGLPVGTVGQQKAYDSEELPTDKQAAKATYTGDTGVAESVDRDVRTLDDLIRACKIDLEVWEIEKYVVNKWAVSMREPSTTRGGRGMDAQLAEGGNSIWTRGSHVPVREQLFQVKAWLRKKREVVDLKNLLAKFLAEAESHAPVSFKWSTPNQGRDCLYLLNIQDLHLAKLATEKETGDADWDIRIAEKVYNTAIEDLLGKAPRDRIEEIIVIVGSDMLQIDNDSSQTRAGTYVDSDSRLSKAFDVCANMVTENIEKLAKTFRVRVVVIPGNHDTTVSLYLGHYVAAWFRNHPNVIVDKEPKSRKYVGYGKTLIGFDHGNDAKRNSLPLTMMRENQATVSQYRYFEFITGHLHKDSTDEIQGVKVRIAPALCSADKWHAGKGFLGNIRTSQGLLYNRENGLEAIYYSTPLN